MAGHCSGGCSMLGGSMGRRFLVGIACLGFAAVLAGTSPLAAATILRDVYGCSSPAMLDRLDNFIAQGDKDQFEKLAGRLCVPLSKGQNVTSRRTVKRAVCVKRRGQSRCYWIARDAVGR